jgi:hypothetical protein
VNFFWSWKIDDFYKTSGHRRILMTYKFLNPTIWPSKFFIKKLAFKIWALIYCSKGHFWPLKVQLSQKPDVLGKFQVQNRNQQLKIYQKCSSLPRGKKRVGLCYKSNRHTCFPRIEDLHYTRTFKIRTVRTKYGQVATLCFGDFSYRKILKAGL